MVASSVCGGQDGRSPEAVAKSVRAGTATDQRSALHPSPSVPASGTRSSPFSPTTRGALLSAHPPPASSARSAVPRVAAPTATIMPGWTTDRSLPAVLANNVASQRQSCSGYPSYLSAALPGSPSVARAGPVLTQGIFGPGTLFGVGGSSAVQAPANIPERGELNSPCARQIFPSVPRVTTSSLATPSAARREPSMATRQVFMPCACAAALASAPASLLAAASASSATNGASPALGKHTGGSGSRSSKQTLSASSALPPTVPIGSLQRQPMPPTGKVRSNLAQSHGAPDARSGLLSKAESSRPSVASPYPDTTNIHGGKTHLRQSDSLSTYPSLGTCGPTKPKVGSGFFPSTSSVGNPAPVRSSSFRVVSDQQGVCSRGEPANSAAARPMGRPAPSAADRKSVGSAYSGSATPSRLSKLPASSSPLAVRTPAGQLKTSLTAGASTGSLLGVKAAHPHASSAAVGSGSPSEVSNRESSLDSASQGRVDVASGEREESILHGFGSKTSGRSNSTVQSGYGSSSRAPTLSVVPSPQADRKGILLSTGMPAQSDAAKPLFLTAAAHGETRPSGHSTPASSGRSIVAGATPTACPDASNVRTFPSFSQNGVLSWRSSRDGGSSESRRGPTGGQQTPSTYRGVWSSASPVDTTRSFSKADLTVADGGGGILRSITSSTVNGGNGARNEATASEYARPEGRDSFSTGGRQGQEDGCCPKLWTMTAEDLFGLDITSTCKPKKPPELSRRQKEDQAASAIHRLLEAEADAAVVIKRAEGLRSVLSERLTAELEDEERRFRDQQEKLLQDKKRRVSEELDAFQAKNSAEAEAFVGRIHIGLEERRVAAVTQIMDLVLKIDVSCPVEVVKRFGTRRQLLDLATKRQESPRQIVHHPPGDVLERDTDVITWDDEGRARVEHRSASTHQSRVTDLGSFWVRHQSKVHQHSNRPLVLLSTHSWQEDDELEGGNFPKLGSFLEPCDATERGKSSFL